MPESIVGGYIRRPGDSAACGCRVSVAPVRARDDAASWAWSRKVGTGFRKKIMLH